MTGPSDFFASNHAAFMAELDRDFVAEVAHRARIANERRLGREAIARMMREWRRELWPKFPDPIDLEDGRRVQAEVKRLGEAGEKARVAFESFRLQMMAPEVHASPVDPFDREVTAWNAQARIAMSVLPPSRSATLITSPA